MIRHPEADQGDANDAIVLCYTDEMLIAQQRGFILMPRRSLFPWRQSYIVLVMFACALLLAPLLHNEELTHDDPHVALAAYLTIGPTVLPETMPASGSASATEPHNHCAIHCSFASLVIPLVLIGASLLAARLSWFFTLHLQTVATPPLSPPPQQAR
jgi:hypothetical protein